MSMDKDSILHEASRCFRHILSTVVHAFYSSEYGSSSCSPSKAAENSMLDAFTSPEWAFHTFVTFGGAIMESLHSVGAVRYPLVSYYS